MNEVSYYPQLAMSLERVFRANLTNESIFVRALYLPTYGHNIRQFLSKYIEERDGNVSESLRRFASDVPRLRTDIALLLDNPSSNKFALVIIEVKLLSSAGLSELSQLIGYSLVTKIKYGLLINIDGGISTELKDILITDKDITQIERIISGSVDSRLYKYGVLAYNSNTEGFDYIETLTGVSLPDLLGEIENEIT